ncbi:cytochrome P450 [Mycena albidolilacea]|uniref:Cytochrome P450 n=1 Tax=Mycena albidolilacea TaxID=1033008 RepID=A0AAD7EPB6_9AGAR|nr:cytochrome P450 [Mycena albidolilacea]
MAYAIALATSISVVALYLLFRHQSPIQNIPGPPSPSWIFGHMRQLMLASRFGDYEFQWLKRYGPVYRLKGCFGQDRLMVADPTALQYILNSPSFYRSPLKDNIAYLLFGEKSVISARGNEHRRLRAALNVGFTSAAVRGYESAFQKAAEMISDELEKFPATATDICPLISLGSLRAISEAIMGVSHQDLGDEFVANTIQIVKLSATQRDTHLIADAVGFQLPSWFWRAVMKLPTTTFNTARTTRQLAKQIGGRIVRDKQDAARQGFEVNNDLFSRLLNPQPRDGTKTLHEDDVVAHTALIVIAGQENTANALSLGLMELARHSDFQHKLRAEIHSYRVASAGKLTYDNMPLLNAFIKETLRLYPGLPISDRVAIQDTVIPLGESITTSTGERINQIPVAKGQLVSVAISSYQRLESHWGEDAHEFNPYRWLDGVVHQGDAVGPYANILTFLGGPRICLGWRFAISEMQIIYCELVGKFLFAEPINPSVRPRFLTSLQPIVSTGGKGLPLCVTRAGVE